MSTTAQYQQDIARLRQDLGALRDAMGSAIAACAKARKAAQADNRRADRAEKADAFSSASGVILGAQQYLVTMSPIPQDYDDDKYWT